MSTNGDEQRARSLIAGSLFVGAFALSNVLVTVFDVPARYGQDPYGYWDLALSFIHGRGFTYGYPWEDCCAPIVPSFAPGYPLVLAVVGKLTGESDRFARAFTAMVGAACPVLCFFVVRSWLRVIASRGSAQDAHRIALFSASLLAVTSLLMRSTFALMSDAQGLALLLATALTGLLFIERLTARQSALSIAALHGLFGALAIATRYGAAPTVALVICATAVTACRRDRPSALKGILVGACTFGGVLFFLLMDVRPETFTDHPVGARWSVLNMFASTTASIDGRQRWSMPLVAAYALDLARPGIAMFGLVVPLIAALVPARTSRAGTQLQVLFMPLAWIASSMLLVVGLPEHNPRFWLLSMPALTTLAAFGIVRIKNHKHQYVAVALLLISGIFGSSREALRMHGQAASERANLKSLQVRSQATHVPLRVFTLTLAAAIHARLPRVGVIEAFSVSDAAWDESLAGCEAPSRFACLVVLPKNAQAQWGATPSWKRIERARERISETLYFGVLQPDESLRELELPRSVVALGAVAPSR